MHKNKTLRRMLHIAAIMACGMPMTAARGAGPPPVVEAALPWPATPSPEPAYARVAAITALGRAIFNDTTLSASGAMACATCHDPLHGFGPANALPVQMGGRNADLPGTRAAPGLAYAQFSPFFTEHFFESDDDGDASVDNGPTGGLTWDGRVDRARQQARIPLLSVNEMANASPAELVAKVARAPYAGEFRALYGDTVFDDSEHAFAAVTEALEVYQQEPHDFAPYTSKYDAFLRGQVQISAPEQHGLDLFEAEDKGNCAHCHKSRPTASTLPLFTDFGMIAIGVPRNRAIPANVDPAYFDLGVCGPVRTDLADAKDYCGTFKAPSLRNVALRQSFFHNGFFHSLRDAVAFYAERDTNPEKFYPRAADGTVQKYDDLPTEYQANVNVEPPFDRHRGDLPALTPAEIDDVVAFLQTLTDGYRAPAQARADTR